MENFQPADDLELEFSTIELSSHEPVQYFAALTDVLGAMQALDANLVAFILPDARTAQRVEQLTVGSIRLKIASIIDYVPDDVLRTGDWKRVAGHFLVEGRKAILQWLRREPKIRDKTLVESLAAELDRIAAEAGTPIRVRRFSRRLLLAMIARLIRSVQAMPGEETVTAVINEERITLPRNAEISTEVARSVAESELEPFEQEMRLLVKKPDMIGASQWDFLDRGYVIRARMSDTMWVDNYHNNKLDLKPGDAIEATVRLTPRSNTAESVYNYEVVKVRSVISSTVTQQPLLFEEQGSEIGRAAPQLTGSSALQARGRARYAALLSAQLALERTLAERVEDAYGLSPADRQLLRSTRPVRDPLDVLAAKLAGVADGLPAAGL